MPLSLKNSATQYGLGGRVLHWTSVALLVTLILTASRFEDLEASTEKVELIREHASYGLIFLLVMSMRLLWRCSNENPLLSYKIPAWQKFSARFLHWGIYVVVITQSLTGLLNLVFAGSSITFFDLFAIPAVIDRHEQWYKLFTGIHFFLSVVIYPLFAIHITAALYHQLFGVLDD